MVRGKGPGAPWQGAGRTGIRQAGEPPDTSRACAPHAKLFSPPDAPLALLRAENARIDRLTAGLRRLCGIGQRTTAEFVLDYTLCGGGLDLLEELLDRCLARLNPDFLAAAGGNIFAPIPLWRVPGSRQ